MSSVSLSGFIALAATSSTRLNSHSAGGRPRRVPSLGGQHSYFPTKSIGFSGTFFSNLRKFTSLHSRLRDVYQKENVGYAQWFIYVY